MNGLKGLILKDLYLVRIQILIVAVVLAVYIVMGRRLITTTLYVPVNVPIEPPPLDIKAITIYTASTMATISICILTR